MESFRGKRIVVTGGSGFIGSQLTERLVKEGAYPHVIEKSALKMENLENVRSHIEFHQADICDRNKISQIISDVKPSIVFHLAACLKRERDPKIIDQLMDVNFKGTLNLLDAAKAVSVDRFIFPSTSDVYGSNKSPFVETQAIDPVSPYSLSKAAAELACKMYFKIFGVPVVILRPFLTYGPRQKPDLLIPELIISALSKKDFKMTKGEQKRDINFVDDLVDAFMAAALKKEAVGETINIGTGNMYRIVDIVKTILDIMGNPIKPDIGALKYRENEIWEMYCGNSKAKKLIGWEPKTSLSEGLEKTIKWYSENWKIN